jgi:hypothetical protein
VLVVLLTSTVSLQAQQGTCAATPRDAAAATISPQPSAQRIGTGYRVQDVQVDPVTRHVWIRVRPCGNDAAPAVLVPMQATAVQVLSEPIAVSAWVRAPSQPVIALRAGDSVRVVWMTSSVRFNVEGKALQQAAEGDTIGVALRGNGNEPGQRVFGTLRANHIVEMQP